MKRAFLVAIAINFFGFWALFHWGQSTQASFSPRPSVLQIRSVSETEVAEISGPRSFKDSKIVLTEKSQKSKTSDPESATSYVAEFSQRVDQQTRAENPGLAPAERSASRTASKGTSSNDQSSRPESKKTVVDLKNLLPKALVFSDPQDQESEPSVAPGSLSSGGGGDYVDDERIALGAKTLLNTDEYVYASFFNRVKREVAPRWEPLVSNHVRRNRYLMGAQYHTQLELFVDSQGILRRVDIVKSSGVAVLDELARSAVREAKAFQNPPSHLLNSEGFYPFKLGFVLVADKTRLAHDYVPLRPYDRRENRPLAR